MPVIKWRRPRTKLRHPISETDKTSQLSSLIQSTSCKSSISTLFSTFSNTNTSNETTHDSNQNITKKNNKNSKNVNNTNSSFSASTFRSLGCTAGTSQQVSVPAVIRSSADWQGKKNRKKKNRRNKTCHGVDDVDFQDVWCGPGTGFLSDAAADVSVDCVVARKNVSSRGKLDNGERIPHREVFFVIHDQFLVLLIILMSQTVEKFVSSFFWYFVILCVQFCRPWLLINWFFMHHIVYAGIVIRLTLFFFLITFAPWTPNMTLRHEHWYNLRK